MDSSSTRFFPLLPASQVWALYCMQPIIPILPNAKLFSAFHFVVQLCYLVSAVPFSSFQRNKYQSIVIANLSPIYCFIHFTLSNGNSVITKKPNLLKLPNDFYYLLPDRCKICLHVNLILPFVRVAIDATSYVFLSILPIEMSTTIISPTVITNNLFFHNNLLYGPTSAILNHIVF